MHPASALQRLIELLVVIGHEVAVARRGLVGAGGDDIIQEGGRTAWDSQPARRPFARMESFVSPVLGRATGNSNRVAAAAPKDAWNRAERSVYIDNRTSPLE